MVYCGSQGEEITFGRILKFQSDWNGLSGWFRTVPNRIWCILKIIHFQTVEQFWPILVNHQSLYVEICKFFVVFPLGCSSSYHIIFMLVWSVQFKSTVHLRAICLFDCILSTSGLRSPLTNNIFFHYMMI